MSDTAAARRLLESGQTAAAERAYSKLLETAPTNIEALNFVALGSLRAGNVIRAQELLERAASLAPDDAITHNHLGRLYDSLGARTRAMAAFEMAVRIEPRFFLARLSLAACLEQSGAVEMAVIHYHRALKDAQGQGRWLDPQTTPPVLRPLVEHAVIFVRQGRHAAFSALLAPLRHKYGRESLIRVERCLRIYLNEEPPEYPDPRQLPQFLLFPDLPTSPYLDLGRFDWIEVLEAETAAIRCEMQVLLGSSTGRERVFSSDALEAENLQGINAEPSWNGYYFYRHGVRREENCRSCSSTARALDRLPLSGIREHGPEVMFSVFTPGTYLKPHRGVTNTRVVGHLPLVVPKDCALRVGGEKHEWREGRVVVFDDTFEHDAWNKSRDTRVVLIFDVWNPYLSEAERAAVTDIVSAIGDFRSAVSIA